jgi:predicted permease
MKLLRRAWRRACGFFRRKDAELAAEIQTHIEFQTEDNIRAGMSPEEARRSAILKFGGIETTKESVRDQRSLPWLETTWQDLRYALRGMRRTPALTAVAILSLALGIGATTAIFSVADAMLLRSLPVKDPQQLVEFIRAVPDGAMMTNLPATVYQHFRDETAVLSGVFAVASERPVIRSHGTAQRVTVHLVSPSFFDVLGVGPLLGRTTEAIRNHAQPAVVLSHGFWSRWFGRDPAVIGSTLEVAGTMCTVAGVMPPGFFGMDRERVPELWAPLALHPRPGELWVAGRLAPGVTATQVHAALEPRFRAALQETAAGFERSPQTRSHLLGQRLLIHSAASGTAGLRWSYWEYSNSLKLLFAIAALVLLICCANLANLLLARGAARWREIGIRFAIGATRARIVRQLLTEHMLLALMAGVLGVAVAAASHRLIVVLLVGETQTESIAFNMDARVLGFGLAASLVTGVLAGLLPAWRTARSHGRTGLQMGSARLPFARSILTLQIALSTVLLTGAGLLTRTLYNVTHADLGFERGNLLLMTVEPPAAASSAGQFWTRVSDAVVSVPGVESASLAGNSVVGGGTWSKRVWVGRDDGLEADLQVNTNLIGPGFFETVGMPVLSGREFGVRDSAGTPRVAVVNEAFARRFFGGTAATGRRLGDGGPGSSGGIEIVGVVANAKARSPRDEIRPMVYQPFMQALRPGPARLHLRLRQGATQEAGAAIVRAISSVEPRVFIDEIRTATEVVGRLARRDRTFAAITGLFAAVAVFLACIGVYGIVAFRASRRTVEIGVRIALGARRRDVVWTMMRETLTLLAVGAALGIPTALAAATALRTMLYGVQPSDAPTIVAAAATLVMIGAWAAFVPAHRASSIAPMNALRSE